MSETSKTDSKAKATSKETETEAKGPVARLPIRLNEKSQVLEQPLILRDYPTHVVIGAKEYARVGSQYNPKTEREEHELQELVLSSQDDLDALLSQGWVVGA